MHNLPQPVRLYYYLPMYRYERPQAGRYREFRQFGIEVIGDPDASVDAEVIEFASLLLESYGITDVTLLLNSIGDRESRPAYIHKLRAYFEQFDDQLSPDDRRRLEANPLRLLDSKEESVQPLLDEAPKSLDSLSQASRDHWNGLLGHLGDAGIEFEIDHRLVRGLDYYARTVFEFVPPGGGSQSTLVAGGRYDGLMEQIGGKPTPGIGFAMGMERVIEDLEQSGLPLQDSKVKVLIAHMGEPARAAAMALASSLRAEDLAAVVAPSGRSLKSQLRYASSVNATHALIIGDDELKKGTVVLRDLGKSEQQEMVADDLAPYLKQRDSAPQADT
jgi:histidyl-tRNA synthetase